MIKKFMFLLCGLFAVCTMLFVACQNEPTSPEMTEPTLTLNETSHTLEMSSVSFILVPTLKGAEGTLRWSSDNVNVATVSQEGVVTAVDIGNCVITVSLNENLYASCAVTVVDSSIKPIIVTDKEEVGVATGGSYKIKASLMYNKQEVEALLSFNSEDDSIAVVDEFGTITGKTVGKTNIIIEGEYDNKKAAKSILVNVYEDVTIDLSSTSVDLTLIDDESVTVKATVTENGKIGEGKIEWFSGDEDIATVSDGVINALKFGQTAVTVSYTAKSGKIYSREIAVNVNRKLDESYATKSNDDIVMGEAPTVLSGPFAENIKEVYLDDEKINFQEEGESIALSYVEFEEFGYGEFDLKVISDNYEYIYRIAVVTGVLRSSADFCEMWNKADELLSDVGGKKTFGGYWVLGANITLGNADVVHVFNSQEYKADQGWLGTFDGRGYTIKVTVKIEDDTPAEEYYGTSLFGSIGATGVIKNLAIDASQSRVMGAGTALVARHLYGTAENLFINVKVNAKGIADGISGAFRIIDTGAKLKNCIAYIIAEWDCDNYVSGLGCLMADKEYPGISDCYIISGGVYTITAAFKEGDEWSLVQKSLDGTVTRAGAFTGENVQLAEASFAAANLNLSSFSKSEYWTVTGSNVPVFNNFNSNQ